MKKLFIISILLLNLTIIVTEELSKEMTVDDMLEIHNTILYYFKKIKITPKNYILTFMLKGTDLPRTGRIDIIHNGNIDSPYKAFGYMYGTDLELGFLDSKSFKVIVPRSVKKVYVTGMGKYDNNAVIDLTKFDDYIPKSLFVKTETTKPTINISNPKTITNVFRTVERFLSITGQVIDNEGIGYVTVNGKKVDLDSQNRFKEKIILKFGLNTVQIKAVDFYDNSTFESINIYRAEYIEPKNNYSDIDFAFETSDNKPNAIAVVIGIEEYQYAPNVANAYNDADIFREYFIKTFGLKRENIYLRFDEKSTKGEFDKVFSENGWISNNAEPNSEIFVYYAGHGVADIETGKSYLIPNDIDPNYATTGYSLNELYQNLSKIKSKSTTIILDACFSGLSRDNEMLLADSRPISIEVKKCIIPENIDIFTASTSNEISSGYKDKKHGLFTYFFLKGLNKEADENNDSKITLEEMENYLKENVTSQAKKMGRMQNPQLYSSDKSKILLEY
ncbi:MAG: caspase family protein [Candidatus Cloacimonetes bacterium]|nr:caspase family protein [Candidatus Cloacimonadota bacterium]